MLDLATNNSTDRTVHRQLVIGPALRRRWWLVLALAVVLALVGAAVGTVQPQTYSAKSTLTVADVDYETRSVPGFVQAAQSLTSSYSQTVGSAAVVEPVAR